MIYRKTGSNISLESAGFAGGRFVARETSPGVSSMVPMIHVTDHLGSVRAVVDGISGAVVESNDYYPFGSRWDVATSLRDDSNRFRYNSKEEQSSLYPASIRNVVSYIDYGARQYDPVLGRWFAQDPLSEKYYGISPYAFCAGNLVKYLDPDGEIIGTAIDVISVGVGIYNLAKNIKAGNSKAAWGDVAGIGLDLASVFIPGVSTGAGLVRVGAKALNLADAGIDMLKLSSELNSFDKAADFGVDTYKNLRKQVTSELGKGSDLEVHHLIEKRFAKELGMNENDIPSIVLTKEEHKKFTAAWREAIGYSGSSNPINTNTASKDIIIEKARTIYKDFPELLKVIEEACK